MLIENCCLKFVYVKLSKNIFRHVLTIKTAKKLFVSILNKVYVVQKLQTLSELTLSMLSCYTSDSSNFKSLVRSKFYYKKLIICFEILKTACHINH